MKKLEKFIKFNSIIILEVKEDIICLRQYDETIKLKFHEEKNLKDIEDVFKSFIGKRQCVINSDVLGLDNVKIKLKRLEKHMLHRMLTLTLKYYLPYLAKFVKEEGSSLLIQSHYETGKPALSITTGLIDDIQVLLLDIHYEQNERVIPC